MPVLRLNDAELAEHDAATEHAKNGRGVAVRLNAEDLDEEAEDIDAALTRVLRDLRAERSDVDLVLDVESVDGDLGVRAGSRLVADVLRGLLQVEGWRTLAVTGGAFPVDLSGVQAWTIGEAPRYDAAMYDHLVERRRLPRQPIYGDYAIAHPVMATGNAFPAPPAAPLHSRRWLA